MFIYILNLLNDGLKKKNICECSASEVINDAMHISQLGNINKNFNFEKISSQIINVFEVLNKYSLSDKDSIEILQMLIRNNHNSRAIEELYNKYYYNSSSNEFKLSLELIIKEILENEKKEKEDMKRVNYCISYNSGERLEIMSKKDLNKREYKELKKVYDYIAISTESIEKVGLVTEGITYAGYEISNETRKVEMGTVTVVL